MLEHARQFLSTVMPSEMGEGAWLNIHWSEIGTGDFAGKKFWNGRACANIDEAIKVIEWQLRAGKMPDLYVCMSLQEKFEKKVGKTSGKEYRNALRLADDAVALQSLFIDIDVKPEAYQTQQEALGALKTFIDTIGLPLPSALVYSGSGGFHAHWALDRTLNRDQWQVLANALSVAARSHGLIFDSQCTIDAARILRIPGTFNYKSGLPREVTLGSLGGRVSVVDMANVLRPFHQPSMVRRTPRIAENDDLGAHMPQRQVEIRVEDVARHCGFVGHALASGGKETPQPLWFMAANIAIFLEDGREALHAMSDQHPGYVPVETDNLFDRVSASQKRNDRGWPTCEKIDSYGCKECTTCPLRKMGKSPIHFALPPPKDITKDETLPEQFVRDLEGVISKRIINDDGTPGLYPVCSYPIINGWLSNNPWTLHFTTRTEMNRKAIIEIPAEVIFGKETFNKFIGAKGIFCTDAGYKILKEFLVSWIQKLQGHKESVISSSPFGWSVVDGKIEGFAYAGRVWMTDMDRPAANPNPVLTYQYTPKGDVKPWRELAEVIYEQNRPALNAILAVAFGAPLVRFTGFPGLILNAYSPESGIGKTTAMKVSQSVWGHPVLAMQGLNDTSNSVLGKMGQIRSLPMYWDEIKSEQQVKRFCSIVFDLTGGREKTRMNSDATLKLSGTWQTMMVSASNDSLVDGMAREVGSTTAGLHRLFEYVVAKPAEVTQDIGRVQRLAGRLEDNYGHAGMIYAKFLGKHWKRVEQEVAAMQDELNTEVRTKQEERMWVATMAVVLMGAKYANELGLMTIDVPALRDFLFEVLARMRNEVDATPSDLNNDMSVSSVLADFLKSQRSRNTIITNRIWIAKGRPPKGSITILNDLSKLGDINVQVGKEDGLIRISSIALTRWMQERGYSRHAFTKKLENEFGLKVVNGKLGGGTDMTSPMEYLVELDINDPKLKNFFD